MSNSISAARVFIVGAGDVGATIAHILLNKRTVSEIVMIDIAADLLNAVVLDLQHAATIDKDVHVRKGSYSELQDGDFVIVTAGAAQKEGQTRLDLLEINAKILRSILGEIKQTAKQVYLIIVTNPVDILTYIALQESGLPEHMVFGSGTFLDSNRLQHALSLKYQTPIAQITGYVLGEHGDSSFIATSTVTVAGKQPEELTAANSPVINELQEQVRSSAYEIIKGKGATNYGIAAAIYVMVQAISSGLNITLPLSINPHGAYGLDNLAIGLPAVLGKDGAKLAPELTLSEAEKAKLQASAATIKDYLTKINL